MPKELTPHIDACIECRYYLEDPDLEPDDLAEARKAGEELLTGFCRRYPPVILLAYPEPVTRHPDVAGATDWCGEFTPKS